MYKAGIIGATGYTGEELLRILARHEKVHVEFATSEKENGESLQKVFPHLPHYKNMSFCSAEKAAEINVDLVFLCLPAGESVKWAKIFSGKKTKVVDLGADFRFSDPKVYQQWYNMPHADPLILQKAVYGLPEWHRDEIRNADIVGNPGCYPTSVLLAVIPFLRAGLLDGSPIIVDAKSGVSGAGKSPSKTAHYVEANESIGPYKVGRVHRHVGEMEKELNLHAGADQQVIFSPHLTPMTRGILSSIYFRLSQKTDKKELLEILNRAYADEPFVHVLKDRLPATKMCLQTNYCFLGLETVAGTDNVVLFSAIDNLGKGASTQAVQNMNLMLGLPETMGLDA
ncbi:MAG: N-acetyl-gamma-glutamyl-phosphate reductase [Calditrichaeota bacterium]|nr:N-acetyl-gamma-glutamyl-phosphate reductase [Calditrichota bacterium]